MPQSPRIARARLARPLTLLLAGALVCLLASNSHAQAAPGVQPRGCAYGHEASERAIGYCQAVRAGNLLFISGEVAAGPMARAVPQVYEQLRLILQRHGLDFSHVVKENLYATDLPAMIQHLEARKAFYAGATPAATWVQVQRLFAPELVLEVELIAEFPK